MMIFQKRTVLWCIVLTYLVILAGAIVRATGSGMGCPDWPKCFGQYIPPTSIDELPLNYKELFKVQGKEIADFNVVHTWVEYLNRLLGVVLGLAVLINALAGFLTRKSQKTVFAMSVMVLLLTLFQGWLGAKVVSSNLAPFKVTLHMALACIILAALIIQHVVLTSRKQQEYPSKKIVQGWFLLFFLFLLQLFAGTQVREMLESLLQSGVEWKIFAFAGVFAGLFLFHQILATMLLGLSLLLCYGEYKEQKISFPGIIISVTLIMEAIAGGLMKMYEVPAWLQPIHVILACLIFGALMFRLTDLIRTPRN
ncbi:MAG: COX15/CtaA family protein [Bacteroidota bacterium]|jgi:cytochrome c oxidase assembly protein subunit 15